MIVHRNRNQCLQILAFYLPQLLGNAHANPYVEVTLDSPEYDQRMDLHVLAGDKTVSEARFRREKYEDNATNLGKKILSFILSWRRLGCSFSFGHVGIGDKKTRVWLCRI